MAEPFTHEETVRWSDVDVMGVMNNAVWLTLFEQTRLAYFTALGLMRGDAFPFVLGSTAARFVRPARVGMRIAVAARVVRLGNKSMDMEYTAACAGERLATGSATLVWVDAELRSVPIPDATRKAIAAREGIPPRS